MCVYIYLSFRSLYPPVFYDRPDISKSTTEMFVAGKTCHPCDIQYYVCTKIDTFPIHNTPTSYFLNILLYKLAKQTTGQTWILRKSMPVKKL